MRERQAAHQLSDAIDRMLASEPLEPGDPLLETASHLSEIVERMPPVPAALERRVQGIVQSPEHAQRTLRRFSWHGLAPSRLSSAVWGALAATLLLALVWFFALGGREVGADMVHALLGQTRIELTPMIGGESRSLREPLPDLVAAELLVGRAPSLPRDLPQDYVLSEVAAVSYPDLPSWISQPLYVELSYGPEGEPSGLRLRQYRLLFRQTGGISGLQYAGSAIAEFEQVNISGAAGTLLTIAGDRAFFSDAPPQAYTVLWERDGLLHELETNVLSKEELLQIARSVR